jgi:hypothetical protein
MRGNGHAKRAAPKKNVDQTNPHCCPDRTQCVRSGSSLLPGTGSLLLIHLEMADSRQDHDAECFRLGPKKRLCLIKEVSAHFHRYRALNLFTLRGKLFAPM